MSSETLPNQGLPQTVIRSPNKYTPDVWLNKPHPAFGFLEIQARDGVQRGWLQFMPPQGFIIFGRDLGAAHIFVGHPTVSNQHAVAAWDVRDGKCYILDLESEHGTFVNDQVIEHSVPCELRPGVKVRFGRSAHIYVFEKLPEELIDPNLEAPTIDRSMDTRTEASQPPFDERFPPDFDRGRPDNDHLGPPPDFDRGPPDNDRRGPPPDFDRRGPPDSDRRLPPDFDRGPPDNDRRGPPPDFDRGPPDDDRRPPPDFDRGPPDNDRRGPPPDFDRGRRPDFEPRGPQTDFDRRGPPEFDRRPPPPEMDRRGPGPEGWSPDDRRFDRRPFDGDGRGPPDRFDDGGRYDQQRTPPRHRGDGQRRPHGGSRSPREARGRDRGRSHGYR